MLFSSQRWIKLLPAGGGAGPTRHRGGVFTPGLGFAAQPFLPLGRGGGGLGRHRAAGAYLDVSAGERLAHLRLAGGRAQGFGRAGVQLQPNAQRSTARTHGRLSQTDFDVRNGWVCRTRLRDTGDEPLLCFVVPVRSEAVNFDDQRVVVKNMRHAVLRNHHLIGCDAQRQVEDVYIGLGVVGAIRADVGLQLQISQLNEG